MSKYGKYALTTMDNPYSPFDDFINWWNFDHVHGYCSQERLNSIADVDDKCPQSIADEIYYQAMLDLVAADPLNLFRIVTESDYRTDNGLAEQDPDLDDLVESIKDREVSRDEFYKETE